MKLAECSGPLLCISRQPTGVGTVRHGALRLSAGRAAELAARAAQWAALIGRPDADPPVPPYLALVRSVRAGGDTKTRKSRRGVELAQREMIALRVLWEVRPCSHELMSACTCLVIVTRTAKPMGASNVRRDFRTVMEAAGLVGREWTPRELRQSFGSLLSDERVPLEVISRLVGHRSTTVTETVYRKQQRPVIEWGIDVMDRIFPPLANPGP
jgi:Phage integrase family